MSFKKFVVSLGFITAIIGTLVIPKQARADDHRRHYGHEREWRGGHWMHDRHDGRLGWWWVIGSAWYFYERPHTFVVQPTPQTVVVQQAPPVYVQQAPVAPPVVYQQPAPAQVSPVLYYCKATGTHYPETMTCPGGWSIATAEAPPQP